MYENEIKVLKCDPELSEQSRLDLNVVFSEKYGLKMHIVEPWEAVKFRTKYYPLVVFVMGSGWMHPELLWELPQLCVLANRGYVVATIEYRNSTEGNPFPAYLQDLKTAIRFLRANREKYMIDPDRVAAFGTSSGANASILAGLTANDPAFKTEEYADESDAVNAVIGIGNPTDLPKMITREDITKGEFKQIKDLAGDRPIEETMMLMSPVNYIKPNTEYPAFLLFHGSIDDVVPYEQSVILYEKFRENGIDVKMFCVEGAKHDRSVETLEVRQEIYQFLEQKLR